MTSGRYYTYTFSNDLWAIGCFYGTTKELKEHLTKRNEAQRFEYSMAIKYVKKLRKFKEAKTELMAERVCKILNNKERVVCNE